AGVIATRPATAPAAAPSTLGAPLCSHETVIHVSAPIAAAVFVTTNAFAARPPAVIALPALKPNQPNQRSDAPRTVIVASWGSVGAYGPGSWPTPRRASQSRPPMRPPWSGPNASV